ncbi:MAG TPA: glycine cleavage T C-terminal barrel domain-containing protein [Polyangiaceae bacterium]
MDPRSPHPGAQVEAARTSALAVPHAELATLVVTGGDRVSWLNGLLTCDLAKRAPGAAVYGLAVARNGRVLADAIVVFDDAAGRVLVAVPAEVVESLRAHLDHYLVMEDVEMAPATDAFEAWSLHGPRSGEALRAALAVGAVGGALDRTGLGGAFLLAPADTRGAVRSALAAEAAVGDEAGWEALRLARAVPRFGVDFDDKTYPQEAALERSAVSFDKGCYLGQEVVCMLELRGHVKRLLVPVVLDAPVPPERGAAVTDEAGASIGEVTSSGASPTPGKSVVLAMVKRAQAEPGKSVVVGGARGEVVARPA